MTCAHTLPNSGAYFVHKIRSKRNSLLHVEEQYNLFVIIGGSPLAHTERAFHLVGKVALNNLVDLQGAKSYTGRIEYA